MIPEVHTPIEYSDVIDACKVSVNEKRNVIQSFEKDFANYIGTPYARCVSSGRSALYIILSSLRLKPGEEIIIPAYTSPIIPQILLNFPITPVYADIDDESLNMTPEAVTEAISDKTRAIIPIHMFGNPCRIDEIREIALEKDIVVIEDAAQALGAEFSGKKVGGFGDSGFFSFGLGKNMTTIEGGMIVSKREDLADRIDAHLMSSQKKFFQTIKVTAMLFLYPFLTSPKFYEISFRVRNPMRETHLLKRKHVFLKYTSIQAALGKSQLTKIADFNEQRIKNAERIIDEVEHLEWFSFQKSHKLAKPVFLRLIVRYNRKRNARDRLMKEFVKHGFDVPVLNDYYLLPYLRYGKYPRSIYKMFVRIKREVVDKMLALPTNPSLSDRDIDCLISVLKDTHYLS